MTDPIVLRALRILIQCRLDHSEYLQSETIAALQGLHQELTRELETQAVIKTVAPLLFPEDVWSAFHHVWSWAVDKPGYDKPTFVELEADLLRMHRNCVRERA